MKELIDSEPFILGITVFCYWVGLLVNKKFPKPITSPIFISLVLLIPLVLALGIEYETYEENTHLITFLLGPTVVALGYNMHKQVDAIKSNIVPILITIVIGSVVGVLTVVGICWLGGVPKEIVVAMEPKSVTMPIALGISQRSGGILALTAVSVAICGIFGSVVGPWLLAVLRVKSPVARGLAMGAAAHGVGTGRALQMGQIEGAVAGMAIGLMGIATAIVIPFLRAMGMD